MKQAQPIGKHRRGLHYVAIFEASKGLIVLVVGLGLLDLSKKDVQTMGIHVIDHFGVMHDHSKVLLHLLKGITQGGIVLVSVGAIAYALIRLIEAYGLWKQKAWAEWLAILSCGLYLPYEFYEIFHRFTWLKVAVAAFNILLLLYLVYVKFIDVKLESSKA